MCISWRHAGDGNPINVANAQSAKQLRIYLTPSQAIKHFSFIHGRGDSTTFYPKWWRYLVVPLLHYQGTILQGFPSAGRRFDWHLVCTENKNYILFGLNGGTFLYGFLKTRHLLKRDISLFFPHTLNLENQYFKITSNIEGYPITGYRFYPCTNVVLFPAETQNISHIWHASGLCFSRGMRFDVVIDGHANDEQDFRATAPAAGVERPAGPAAAVAF